VAPGLQAAITAVAWGELNGTGQARGGPRWWFKWARLASKFVSVSQRLRILTAGAVGTHSSA
jgi:hypothetical protein